MAQTVEAAWKDPAGRSHPLTALLADISVSGASLRTPRPVQVGTAITFTFQNQELTGKVRHCVLRKPDYVVGMEFGPGCRWSRP